MAKKENEDTEDYMKSSFWHKQRGIHKIENCINNVSSNLQELEMFTGRFLKHIYHHKMESDNDQE